MLHVKSFAFNPFQENTYLLYNDQKSCIIIDPGMYNASEQKILDDFIQDQHLLPEQLINTHCHIDHILSNTYCSEKYNLPLQAHVLETEVLKRGSISANMYGLHYHESVPIAQFIDENKTIQLGDDIIKILFTPGHSPGSLSFYSEAQGFVIAGDTLFNGSIGRTDLPGGDHFTLIEAIKTQLLSLPPETIVYSGHGPSTNIGREKVSNPYVRG